MPALIALVLATLVAACAPRDTQRAAGDSARCEASANAPGCRLSVQRPDDNWRTSGFGGY